MCLVSLPSLHHLGKRRKYPLLQLLREPYGTVSAQGLCARAELPSGGKSPTMDVWSHCSIYPHPAGASKGLLPAVTRGGNHLRLPGMLCVQSCLWCSELFTKYLQDMEPTVWLTKCARKTGSKLGTPFRADCVHCVVDNNNTLEEIS